MRHGAAAAASVCVLATLLAPAHASAEPPPDWRERPQLSGEWGGLRPRLAARGIRVFADYLSGFWSNVSGGFETGTRYEGFARWGASADLEALAGWRGADFHIGWHAYHGSTPSKNLIGSSDAQSASGWEAEKSVRFYNIYLQQELLKGALLVKVGQIAADDDFFQSPYAAAFANAAFGDRTDLTESPAPVYPLAAPGVYLEARPARGWFARFGVYTGDPGEDETSNFGFDWNIGGDSRAILVGEVGAILRPLGRPGRYAIGARGNTRDHPDFRSGGTVEGAYALNAMIDQALLLDANGKPKLGAFLRAGGSPQDDRIAASWRLNGGLVLFGPLPSRERDLLGLGFGFIHFADDYVASKRAAGDNVTRREGVLELTYRAQLTGWLTLQPNLQFFFDPHLSGRDAVVIGLQAIVRF